MSFYKRLIWFIRSHDRSTPEKPRKNGGYGWPKQSSRDGQREIEPIFDADLNLIKRPKS